MDNGPKPKVLLHGKANRSQNGEETDISAMIDRSGCSDAYYKLEDCLAGNDRDWRKCQNFVKLWKQCSDKQKSENK
ncbi:hypothetical protein EON65_31830 [archaeon]|nr:MAG: hypothetical protein EON65_31830 [archaeon]